MPMAPEDFEVLLPRCRRVLRSFLEIAGEDSVARGSAEFVFGMAASIDSVYRIRFSGATVVLEVRYEGGLWSLTSSEQVADLRRWIGSVARRCGRDLADVRADYQEAPYPGVCVVTMAFTA